MNHLLLALLITVAVFPFVLIFWQAHFARKGLGLIEEAKLPPKTKIELMYQWRNPFVSRKKFNNLKSLIADLEAEYKLKEMQK